jgi:hypothetical protein
MASGILQPTARTPGAAEVDPVTRGGREPRRNAPRRRSKPKEDHDDEERESTAETAASPQPRRIDVLA